MIVAFAGLLKSKHLTPSKMYFSTNFWADYATEA